MSLAGLLERRFGDRVNPVLVRELRQALRGKQFRITFALAATAGLIAALGVVVFVEPGSHESMGLTLFGILSGCLALASLVLVPISAFQSLAAEWEENTFDMLALSNLRPRQIALGKLYSSGLQALLYFSGLAPFLVFCFLLRGVGMLPIVGLLATLLAVGACLSAIALALSSLARTRLLRGVLMGLFVLVVMWAGSMGVGSLMFMGFAGHGGGVVFSGPGGGSGGAIAGFVFFLCFPLMATWVAVAIACARLSHPEENRSTPLRVALCAVVVVLMSWMVGAGAIWSVTLTSLYGTAIGLATLLGVFAALFASEREELGRRVRLLVPRTPLRAALATPLLPGGARGFLWLVCGLGGIAMVTVALRALIGSSGWPALGSLRTVAHVLAAGVGAGPPMGVPWNATLGLGPTAVTWQSRSELTLLLVWMAYVVIYVGLPSALLALVPGRRAWRRVAAALAPFALALACLLLPAIAGLVLDVRTLRNLDHIGNPVWVLSGVGSGREDEIGCAGLLLIAALLVVVLNVPRMLRGWREVQAASVARLERERALAERAPAPADALGATGAG